MTLHDLLATNPDGTLEDIASQYNTSLFKVVKALPAAQCVIVPGDRFDRVWESIAGWGEVTLISHTADAILEFKSALPTGTHRHGYFNLRGNNGLSGHIRAVNCRHIAFIERKFMGMDTASVVFFNADGAAMFKIFLGRDSHRQLLTSQVDAFHTLAIELQPEQV
ncbi:MULTISPECIES: heme utilization cystosolic carrier protein HutX [unclassified Brenneria]|uniref:heme utilization cystosolic carrier protein HutX n=1 Tax=unclassified Brenneria TaxID=2634434 RepID=UPI001F1F4D42|nr:MULTISPECIES: heme utilization cystosolic carrier protein HutX [unclassified Brenneria]MEE3642577.1 heme utilization cystosolic carrier protein HutX [Brenneria sp. L3_3C_1]MEE3650051.1 heme utilization cystosolic carrier protein HutX [Brenneria sp. HEZEL_4_2_4]